MQRRGHCARTSLAVTTRKPAPCVRATASRHVGWRAQGSRHTSGAKASRSTHRLLAAISGWGSDEGRRRLRFSAGAAATQVATLNAAGGAMVPVVTTRTREANSTRTDSRAAPATLRLHRDVSILRQAQDCYVAKNAFASATEATDNVAWPLLKNRVLRSGVNTWPPLSGCLLTEQRLSI